MKNMLELNNIDVYYGRAQVLWGVSLQLEKAQAMSIVGPNGAGKTTLLKAITNIQPPTRGTIIFKDESLENLPTEEVIIKGISLIPEGGRVFPAFSVKENLEMGTFVKESKQAEETLQWVYQLFPKLEEREEQIAKTLSGGERQMLAVGRGLMQDPEILLLDEPSLGLAPMLVKEVFEVLNEVKKEGLTIVLVEQDVVRALKFADRGCILEKGRIAEKGDANELLASKKIKEAYLGFGGEKEDGNGSITSSNH